MKKFCAFIFMGLVAGCLPTQTPNQIQVEGEATIEVMPDIFELSASIHSRSSTQAQALAEASATYSKIQEDLPQLEGLEKLAVTTSEVSIVPIYDYECQEKLYDEEQCPIIAYSGIILISVKGAPVSVTGNTLSFVSELGADVVEFDAFRVSNLPDYQQKAISTAVQNARKKAELIATASGETITGAVKIQAGRDFDSGFFEMDADTIIVTGSRIQVPRVSLDIEPQPISVSAKVVAAFEIE